MHLPFSDPNYLFQRPTTLCMVRGGRVVRCRTSGFESHPRLLCTNANSACYPFGVG